ncbi:hypothetical protein LTR36_002598 [Oleoguttula mirabilis]|uniref:Phosphodiest-domain-containing protein n=1 Tax=Oleoguttula mirabilis TaxID=1507867 RepID=A0AAV9JK75_9PEZI|nr:hypothetical protein LTR36_002598 [Oleoguttula mirabilis]
MARSDYEKVDGSEGGSDDESLPRTSGEVGRHDEDTLTAEEEAEKLLGGRSRGVGSTLFGGGDGRQDGGRRKRGSKRQRKGEKREVMYEMEEGGPRSSSAESSGHSSEVDMAKMGETQQAGRKQSKGLRFGKFAAIHVVIVVAFLALLYGAYRASQGRQRQGDQQGDPSHDMEEPTQDDHLAKSEYQAQSLSNGTHTFAPTTILISLDGFRADFLYRNLTPTLSDLVRSGVSPMYMNPSFPSLTFPNHFTLVTGLHPESHGVVGNTFWDPTTQKEFYYTDPGRSMQPEWWNAEPLWETAELQGVRTAIHMWPGSEAHIGSLEPAYVDVFNADEELDNKVDRILGWLDLPGPEDVSAKPASPRPQLIAAYVPNVDSDGHLYGPNSTYIRSTIAEVDGMLSQLFRGIDERNLTDIVNVVIVSDHGMATTSVNRLIQLEDILDTSLIDHTDGWPLYGLRPYDHAESHLRELYDGLIDESKMSKYKGTFDVYLRSENMPARYHFSDNARIAPLWIVPKPGWAIVTEDEFDVATGVARGLSYSPRGLHGYDNQHALMRAIFIARGPAFPHAPGSQLEPFQNTEVYNIVCDSLGITPVRNNGTLRLPLKPTGLHDIDEWVEVPEDSQDDENLALPPEVPNLAYPQGVTAHLPAEVPNLANRPDFMVPTADVPAVSPTPLAHTTSPEQPDAEALPTTPAAQAEATDGEKDHSESGSRWWNWVTGKLEAIKGWAGTLLSSPDDHGQDDVTRSAVS